MLAAYFVGFARKRLSSSSTSRSRAAQQFEGTGLHAGDEALGEGTVAGRRGAGEEHPCASAPMASVKAMRTERRLIIGVMAAGE